jgi:anti-sigma factor RsiW
VRGQRPRNKPGATVVDAERMPRQTFEEAVLPHLDAAFNDAQVRHWNRNDMSFWAVSDLNADELGEFVRALQP